MDMRTNIRAIVAGLVGISLVVLVFVLIFKGFSGGPTTPSNLLDLGKYSGTPAVSTLLVDGPVNLDQDHRQMRITVSQTQTQIEVMKGYQGTVIDTRSYPNNAQAYESFLQSLQQMNFTRGTNTKLVPQHEGFCPSGQRYVFGFNDGNVDKFQYWTSSCGGGTYRGQRRATLNLFRAQIPPTEYTQLTRSLPFSL